MFRRSFLSSKLLSNILKQNFTNPSRNYARVACIIGKVNPTSYRCPPLQTPFHSTNYQYTQKAHLSSQPSSSSSNTGVWYWLIGGSLAIGTGLVLIKKFGEKDEPGQSATKSKKIFVDLPEKVPYLIIGTGVTAHSASRAIRAKEVFAKVLMVGDEMYPPYSRYPLSKDLWHMEDREKAKHLTYKAYNGKDRTIFFEKEGYYAEPKDLDKLEHGGTAVALGLKASRIDVEQQIVHFDNGQKIQYEKCLIATGGSPKNLDVFNKAPRKLTEKVMFFRTVEDFKKLHELVDKVQSIVIVGGGFLGTELGCVLGKKATELKTLEVTQVFPEEGNLGQVLPEYLSKFVTKKVRQEGTKVLPNQNVKQAQLDKHNDKILLILDGDNEISADLVIVAVGLDPNIELASASELEVDPHLGGFLVNAELEARTNLWAAGDAACFYDSKLGRRRVEHHDHALVSGRLAGMNMTGARKPYAHQSMVWSDIGPFVGFQAIGLIDSTLPTVSVFAKLPNLLNTSFKTAGNNGENAKQTSSSTGLSLEKTSSKVTSLDDEEYGKGLVFYLKDNAVVGILMWNVFSGTSIARQILKEGTKYDDYSEVAKLFNLFGAPSSEDDEDDDIKEEEIQPKPKKQIGEGAGFYVGR